MNKKNSVPLGTPYGLAAAFRLPYNKLLIFMLYLTAQSGVMMVLYVTHV